MIFNNREPPSHRSLKTECGCLYFCMNKLAKREMFLLSRAGYEIRKKVAAVTKLVGDHMFSLTVLSSEKPPALEFLDRAIEDRDDRNHTLFLSVSPITVLCLAWNNFDFMTLG